MNLIKLMIFVLQRLVHGERTVAVATRVLVLVKLLLLAIVPKDLAENTVRQVRFT